VEIKVSTNRTAIRIEDLVHLAQKHMETLPEDKQEVLVGFFKMLDEEIPSLKNRVRNTSTVERDYLGIGEAPRVGSYVGDESSATFAPYFDVDAYEDYYTVGKKRFCEHCHGSLMKSSHGVSKMLDGALRKTAIVAKHTPLNYVHRHELCVAFGLIGFGTSQMSNFYKLQYFGLVAKLNGNWSGEWCITQRGLDYLCGKVTIHKRIDTFRGYVTNVSEEMVIISTPKVDIEKHGDFAANASPSTKEERDVVAEFRDVTPKDNDSQPPL
jgi:hypothetical protein